MERRRWGGGGANLLEGVGREAFEAVNVQDADGGRRGGCVDEPLVAAADEPAEEAAVQRLARGVARFSSLRHRARHESHLVAHLQPAETHGRSEVGHAEERRDPRQHLFGWTVKHRRLLARGGGVGDEGELRQEQHRREPAHHRGDLSCVEADGRHRAARAPPVRSVVHAVDLRAARLVEERQLLHGGEEIGQVDTIAHSRRQRDRRELRLAAAATIAAARRRQAGHKLVEHVIVALALRLADDPAPLEQVEVHARSGHLMGLVELQLDELAWQYSTRMLVSQ